MMKQPTSQASLRLGFLPIAIIVLAVIAAVIHLYLGVMGFMTGHGGPFPPMFILNFAGYMVLVTALYLPSLQRIQRITRWILIAYTALTIFLWYVIASSHPSMFDYADKSVEGALVILLLVDAFRPHQRQA
jgi:hypothetical protein